jgi:hypothetical protein
MGKVITERPRGGWRYKSAKGERKALQKGFEDSPKREKIRQKWNWGCKHFTDVIGPLEGFILANVGRPWDKVYSEVRAVLKPTGMSAIHAIGHLFDCVALAKDIYISEKHGPCFKANSFWRRDRDGEIPIYQIAYVDPNDGILKKNKWKDRHLSRPPRQKKPRLFIKVDDTHVYKKVDDIWYVVTLANYQDVRGLYDVVLKCHPREYRKRHDEYGGDFYAVAKRQLNSREIKANKLNERLA